MQFVGFPNSGSGILNSKNQSAIEPNHTENHITKLPIVPELGNPESFNAKSNPLSHFVDGHNVDVTGADPSPSVHHTKALFMFSQALQYFLSLWKKPRGATHDDLKQWEVSYKETLTMFDCERVLVEDGLVVGNTAVITDTHDIEQTSRRLPSGYFPSLNHLIVVSRHRLKKTVRNSVRLQIAWRS
jgi:hypothetical protein